MTTLKYPVFVYRSRAGLTVRAPDFPQAADAFGRDYATAMAAAEADLLSELTRMRAANVAPPPPTSVNALVSTKGGSVEIITLETP